MIYGGIISQEPNMIEKALPITVAPIEGECLKTFLMRTASVYGVSSERFIEHCFRIQGQGRRTLPYGTIDTLTTRLNKNLIHPLSSALSVSNLTLRQLTIAGRFPSASSGLMAFTGASKCLDTGDETLNHQLRFGWCPLCLMADRAEGEHHHLRPEWSLAFVTMCQTHKRPLIGRCQMCYHFVTSPDYAMYKDQLALVCPHCFTPLDGRLGYDFVSNEDAHCWNGDDVVQAVWERIVQYERLFLRAVKSRAGHTKSLHVLLEFSALVDLLLRTQIPDRHRSIDLFASPYLPSPTRLGLATRHLDHPFHISQLVERRKALAVIICMLEDANEMFRLDPCFPPMQQIREHLDKPTYNQFERRILNITRYALPN